MHDEDKDITYINERNRKFNEKIDRSYSKVFLLDFNIMAQYINDGLTLHKVGTAWRANATKPRSAPSIQ